MGILDIFAPQEDNGLLDPRRAAAAGLFAGLTNFGAQLAAAGAPRVGTPGPGWGGGLAMAAPAFQQAYSQGQQNYMQQGMLNQEVGRQRMASRIFGDMPNEQLTDRERAIRSGMPENMRNAYSLLDPRSQATALVDALKQQQSEALLTRAIGALGGGGMPAAPAAPVAGGAASPVPASAPAGPSGPPATVNPLERFGAIAPQFPGMQITSGNRTAEQNAAVRGASNSRHLHGDALDIDLSRVPAEQRPAVLEAFRAQGATGFGMYDREGTRLHVDWRGTPTFWGPNRSRTSIGETPAFFQTFVSQFGQGNMRPAAPAASAAPATAAVAPSIGVSPSGAPMSIPNNAGGIDASRLLAVAPALASTEAGRALLPVFGGMVRQNGPQAYSPGQFIYSGDRLVGQIPQLPAVEPAANVRYRALLNNPNRTEAETRELATLERSIGPEPSSQNVTVSADRTAQDRLSEGAITRINELRTAATTAVDTVQSAQRVLDILKSNAGAITGTGAEWRNSAYRLLATAGVIDPERVANTEQLVAELSSSALAQIRRLPGPASDRDVRFVTDVAAGRISLTPQVIERVARLNIEYGQRAVSEYNSIITPIHEDPRTSPVVRSAYGRVELPAAPAAPRQTGTQPLPPPEVGTVREGYRFRGGDPSRRENWEQVR